MDPRDGELVVTAQLADERLDRALRGFRSLSWSQLRGLIARGHVSVNGRVVRDAGARVRAGDRVRIEVGKRPPGAPAPTLPAEALVHVDRDVVVVDKPAGIPTVPFAGETEPTLDVLVARALGRGAVRVVQRLDRDTSGLLVFARNAEAERGLAQQLRFRTMQRRYLALVHGRAQNKTIRSCLGVDRGDGLRGSVPAHEPHQLAITHVEVVEHLAGATLVACRLETGRTHQIRIHLAEDGHMLLGERAYVREHAGPVLVAPRICLHAAELGFAHPRTEERLRFSRALPQDLEALLTSLRQSPLP